MLNFFNTFLTTTTTGRSEKSNCDSQLNLCRFWNSRQISPLPKFFLNFFYLPFAVRLRKKIRGTRGKIWFLNFFVLSLCVQPQLDSVPPRNTRPIIRTKKNPPVETRGLPKPTYNLKSENVRVNLSFFLVSCCNFFCKLNRYPFRETLQIYHSI